MTAIQTKDFEQLGSFTGKQTTSTDAFGQKKSKSEGSKGIRGLIRKIFAPVLVVLAKLKTILLLLPKAKVFLTMGTMAVSVVAYSLFWGWEFAVGFVLILLVHEMGHVVQLRREGIKASAPFFIPFMGAVISAKSLGEDALAEARVGLAGPVIGSAVAVAVLAPLWFLTHDQIWLGLLFTAAYLNAFNLIPMPPLDGSRACSAISPKLWFVGLIIILGVAVTHPGFAILWVILFIGGLEWMARRKRAKTEEGKAYYKVAAKHRVAVAAVYFGLAATLAAIMALCYVPHIAI